MAMGTGSTATAITHGVIISSRTVTRWSVTTTRAQRRSMLHRCTRPRSTVRPLPGYTWCCPISSSRYSDRGFYNEMCRCEGRHDYILERSMRRLLPLLAAGLLLTQPAAEARDVRPGVGPRLQAQEQPHKRGNIGG